jgi:hypothetical protein
MICINTIGLNEWLFTFCNFSTQNWICLTLFTFHFSGLVHLTKEKVHPHLLLTYVQIGWRGSNFESIKCLSKGKGHSI